MADQFHHAAPSIILVLRTENIFVCSIKMVCRDLHARFRPARLLFASRTAILATGHSVDRTVTGLTTICTGDADNG
jgi:hypothetical protein